jgi:hypothetical protein
MLLHIASRRPRIHTSYELQPISSFNLRHAFLIQWPLASRDALAWFPWLAIMHITPVVFSSRCYEITNNTDRLSPNLKQGTYLHVLTCSFGVTCFTTNCVSIILPRFGPPQSLTIVSVLDLHERLSATLPLCLGRLPDHQPIPVLYYILLELFR